MDDDEHKPNIAERLNRQRKLLADLVAEKRNTISPDASRPVRTTEYAKPPFKMTRVMGNPSGKAILDRFGGDSSGPMSKDEARAEITRLIKEAKRRKTD